METPVAFFVFNRPAVTRRVLESLRAAHPRRLLVVADGPRDNLPGEAERIAEVRQIIETGVTWPCALERIYADTNLGCGRRIASGLTEVFHRVENAIVLEDDCLPDASFFPYCEEMLLRYRDEPRVGVVSGDDFQRGRRTTGASYYFSRYPHCWGWATWRRAWQRNDPAMAQWPELREQGWIERTLEDPAEQRYWRAVFDSTHAGHIDSWDYQWTFTCWVHRWLTVLPAQNLVSNIGFDGAGTHTTHHAPGANLPTTPLRFPLLHPAEIARDRAADAFTFQHHFATPPLHRRVLRRLRSLARLKP